MPPTYVLFPRVLLIAFFYKEVHADITDSPENQAVRANDWDVVIMKCETNSANKPLMWAAFDGGSDPVSIFDGETVNPNYKKLCWVTPNAGRFDLHVMAKKEMALKFKCIQPGAENIETTAELIVLENDPNCSENVTFSSVHSMEVEKVTLTCVVNYAGNWAPNITWADISGQDPLSLPSPVLTMIPSKSVTSVLHLAPDAFVKEMRVFECRTKFTLESYKGDATARNVPAYKRSCQLKYDKQKYITKVIEATADYSKGTMQSTLSPMVSGEPDAHPLGLHSITAVDNSGPPAGVIGGIVFVVVALIAVVAGIFGFLIKKKIVFTNDGNRQTV